MKSVSLSGSLRGNVGKKDAKKQRREGNVPCVMYGGKDQIHFAASEKILSKLLHTPEAHIIKLTVDGKEYDTIMQDVQYHPVTDRLLHVDLLQILPGKPVTIAVPVKLSGTAPGVLRGGKLIKKLRKLKISALSENLPDDMTVSIEGLEIGDSVKVSQLTLENVTFLDAPSTVIVGVRTARAVVEEVAPGAEGAAPEGTAAEGEKKEEGK